MQVSNSIISYKSIIPIFTVCLLILSAGDVLLALVLISAGAYFLYVIYQRTFKISKKNLLSLIISVAVGLLLAFVCYL